jgi:hypothetical protein
MRFKGVSGNRTINGKISSNEDFDVANQIQIGVYDNM